MNNMALAMEDTESSFKTEAGIQILETAKQIAPENQFLSESLGRLLMNREQFAEAIPHLEHASLNPRLREPCLNRLIECTQKLGRKEAVDLYRGQLNELVSQPK